MISINISEPLVPFLLHFFFSVLIKKFRWLFAFFYYMRCIGFSHCIIMYFVVLMMYIIIIKS